MDDRVVSVRRAYDSAAVAARYDAARFSSAPTRLYAARQRQLVRRCLARFGRVARLLDLPCGTGRLLPLAADAADFVVGVDAAPAMLARALRRSAAGSGALCAGDATELPLATEAVDVVLCVRFLHLLPPAATVAVLSEITRVARRGAIVATLVSYPLGPVGNLRRRLLRRPLVLERPPSLAEWTSRCAAAGLTLAESHRVWPGVSSDTVMLLRR
ncbi:hypothetical protein tb265_27180 [Gemmatimonadetes bacterium T265]|nr:hypothetical protein tb265_27180 [Gemmatimonadetes bacterium T265]